MAGWTSWNDVQVASSASVGRTVLETIWPDVQRLAAAHQWRAGWVDQMLDVVSSVIVTIKRSESPLLDREEYLQAAVRAGEIFANSRFHHGVCRFDTAADAQNWIMTHVRGHPPVRALQAAVLERIRQNARLQPLVQNQQGQRPGWGAGLQFDTYIEWLHETNPDVNSATTIGNALIAYVCGLCKMGEMSNAWQQSRIRQIRREAQNPDLELIREVCTYVWDFYGVAFKPDAEQYGPFFVWLEEQCQGKRLTRLFITAQQSAAQGCTVLNLIADAQRMCDDFNWNRFQHPQSPPERAISDELVLWGADFTAMVNNPWIRFAGTVGRTPRMANLGYLAKQLLTRAMGVMSVQNYAGLDLGNLTIRHRAWIDRIVNAYVQARNEIQPGEGNIPVLLPAGAGRVRHELLGADLVRPPAARFRPRGQGAQPAGGAPVAALGQNLQNLQLDPEILQAAVAQVIQRAQQNQLQAGAAHGANIVAPAQDQGAGIANNANQGGGNVQPQGGDPPQIGEGEQLLPGFRNENDDQQAG